MATVEMEVVPLTPGDKLSREEFLRRWEAMPDVKRAELVGGIVYMPTPVSWEHGVKENLLSTWLGVYAGETPGCEAGNNATWLIRTDAPQPDLSMRLRAEYGGLSHEEGRYLRGVPEIIAEVCLSSTVYDLHQKMDLYRLAGVPEYLTVLLWEREVRWHRLEHGIYQLLPASPDGIQRSIIFPGLWLDPTALWAGDSQRLLATLQLGLQSPEQAAFVSRLSQQRS